MLINGILKILTKENSNLMTSLHTDVTYKALPQILEENNRELCLSIFKPSRISKEDFVKKIKKKVQETSLGIHVRETNGKIWCQFWTVL